MGNIHQSAINASAEISFAAFKLLISEQAHPYGNAVSVDHYTLDGNKEHFYPKKFTVNSNTYWWSMGQRKTRGRSMSSHYELWGHGPKIGDHRFATGLLTKGKLFRFLKAVWEAEIVKGEA